MQSRPRRAPTVAASILVAVLMGSLAVPGCGDSEDSGGPKPGERDAGSGGGDAGSDAGADGVAGSGGSGGSGGGIPLTCGDGILDTGEQCDDANADDTDGCRANCRFTCERDADCSDRIVCNGVEVCSADHLCGPGSPALEGERCGFSHECRSGTCTFVNINCECPLADVCAGPAICDPTTLECSRTPLADFTPCSAGACIGGVCKSEYCGDSRIQAGEECDDGNRASGDGCEPDCRYSCVPSDPTRNCAAPNDCQNSGVCNSSTHTCSPTTKKANGLSCGAGRNCVEGNCVTIQCRDGILAQGVEKCDDGNNRDGDGCGNDCQFSCESGADCPAAEDCRIRTCLAHVCAAVPDSSQDGNPCNTGAGAATCAGGACTAGVCGDGALQVGEECDFGNQNRVGSGCEILCITSCRADAECDDGDLCNGVEKCETVTVGSATGKRCSPPVARPDGTSCGTGKLCVNGSCRTSFCGDGVTDGLKSEECDPPNSSVCDPQCKAITPCDPTGTWAMKLSVSVDISGVGIAPNLSGQARLWTLASLQQRSLNVTGSLRTCGLAIPDLQTIPEAGSEVYGPVFPDSLFDAKPLPSAPLTGSLSGLTRGSTFTTLSFALQLGVSLNDPFGPWPELLDLQAGTSGQIIDHDGDGKPGVTIDAKTGPLPSGTGYYTYTIVNFDDLADLGRAERLYLALRVIGALNATLVTCDEMAGTVAASSIDLRIVGCRRLETGADCIQRELTDYVDVTLPTFTPTGGTVSAKRVASDATCSQVRALLP